MTMVNGAKAACPNNQTCGENCCWDLTKGVLSISTDDKTIGGSITERAWGSQYSDISSIVIEGADEASGTKGITNIGDRTLYSCYARSVTIPNSVTSIGTAAFAGDDHLTSIAIPDSVTSIGNQAFQNTSSLTSITLPSNLQSIGDWTFSSAGLTNVTVPNSVTNIGDGAFSYMPNLTSITLPDNLISIGDVAFRGSTKLTSIVIPDSVTRIGSNAFYDMSSTAVIYCQEGSGKHSDKTCAQLVSSYTGFQGTLQLYTKDSDGNMILYDKNGDGTITSNGETYDSVDAMLTALATPPEPEPVVTPEPAPGTQTETSDINGSFGTAERGKRIYTVQQANEVAGKKNRVMIRYK